VDAISLRERLSQVETWWNVLKQAHGGSTPKREHARAWLVERYAGAVRHYLTKAVGPEAAADLVQGFAARLLQGRYRKADEAVGRFRNYLKTCLFALVADYRKGQAQAKVQHLPANWEPADPRGANDAAEEEWRQAWRQDLIDRALDALRRLDQGKDKFLYPVLQFRMAQPELPSPEAAQLLSERLGKPVTDGWLRKKLMQARQRFAGLLLEEVARSVHPPTPERVTDELTDLKLLHYCGPLLKRLRGN
jgi:DNA-directed RNA polymerase specialized sigma24 family protein